jgi:hypothetical protein
MTEAVSLENRAFSINREFRQCRLEISFRSRVHEVDVYTPNINALCCLPRRFSSPLLPNGCRHCGQIW